MKEKEEDKNLCGDITHNGIKLAKDKETQKTANIDEIKQKLAGLSGKALLDEMEKLLDTVQLSREDWHEIGYDNIYHRLKDELPDAKDYAKLKVMNRKFQTKYNTDAGQLKPEIIPDIMELSRIKEDAVQQISKTVLKEEANVRKVLNVCLSAYTNDPVNMVFLAESSTGKTYLVQNVARLFPSEDTIILRSISNKAFTRERGRLVLKVNTQDGPEYKETVRNRFDDDKNIAVSLYLQFLSEELENKNNRDDKKYLNELRDERDRIMSGLFTLIDFQNKILVLLEKPSLGFWADMLSVASHDAFFLESAFVEGEGKKYTRHIVYRGWPAILFCTTKQKDFTWQDLETRFEIAAPDESVDKFTSAIDLSLSLKYGINSGKNAEEKKVRQGIAALASYLKMQQPRVFIANPQELRRVFLGNTVEKADLMRKFPRIVEHIGLNTLWNLADRVIFTNNSEYIFASADDFRELVREFSSTELNAALHGFPELIYDFLVNVLIPASKSEGDEWKTPFQAEVCTKLASYGKLGKSKMACSRYLRAIEDRGLIKRERPETGDRRALIIIPLVDELIPLTGAMDEIIEKLLTGMAIAVPPNIEYLLSQNFTAFYRGVEMITYMSNDHDSGKNLPDAQSLSDTKNTALLIEAIMQKSHYSILSSDMCVINFQKSDNFDDSKQTSQNKPVDKNVNVSEKTTNLRNPVTPSDVSNFFDEKNTEVKEKIKLSIALRKVISELKGANPDPVKYPLHSYHAMPVELAKTLKAYQFSEPVSILEFMTMAGEEAKAEYEKLKETLKGGSV